MKQLEKYELQIYRTIINTYFTKIVKNELLKIK